MDSLQPDSPGVPTNVEWAELWTPEPVNRNAPLTILHIRPESGGPERFLPAKTRLLAPLHGFVLHAAAHTSPRSPAQGHAATWHFASQTWKGQTLPSFTFNVKLLGVTWPDAPLRFERQWLPGQGTADLPVVIRAGATPADYHRLADAYYALIRFSELLHARRGPRSYDRDQDRRDIYQVVADRLYAHQTISRIGLAVDLALSSTGFDTKRKRCNLTLEELQSLTFDQLQRLGIKPNTSVIHP